MNIPINNFSYWILLIMESYSLSLANLNSWSLRQSVNLNLHLSQDILEKLWINVLELFRKIVNQCSWTRQTLGFVVKNNLNQILENIYFFKIHLKHVWYK